MKKRLLCILVLVLMVTLTACGGGGAKGKATNDVTWDELFSTLDKWFRAVENGVIIGMTNGFVEGCNKRTKVLKRICYGFRNFKKFRNRLLYIANNTAAKKKRRLQLAIS